MEAEELQNALNQPNDGGGAGGGGGEPAAGAGEAGGGAVEDGASETATKGRLSCIWHRPCAFALPCYVSCIAEGGLRPVRAYY